MSRLVRGWSRRAGNGNLGVRGAARANSPTATLRTRDEFKGAIADQIGKILKLVYVLLTRARVITLFGNANTLALSVFERTREFGLLRAVGMRRSQVRATVRWESVLQHRGPPRATDSSDHPDEVVGPRRGGGDLGETPPSLGDARLADLTGSGIEVGHRNGPPTIRGTAPTSNGPTIGFTRAEE